MDLRERLPTFLLLTKPPFCYASIFLNRRLFARQDDAQDRDYDERRKLIPVGEALGELFHEPLYPFLGTPARHGPDDL